MIFDSLSIAASSLKAQQKAMDVVSHNIANVNTPGYSRQNPELVTISPDKLGLLNFGRGVNLQDIRRITDPIVDKGLVANASQQGYWESLKTNLNTVEHVFGSLDNTGLAAALDDFFRSWQQLANDPQDTAQKINVRAKSQTLVDQINLAYQQLSEAQQTTDLQISEEIDHANELLDRIASLTTQIRRQENGGNTVVGKANDLRDMRDQAVRELAAIIPVQQVSTADGSYMIQSAGGDLLVQDDVSRHLGRGSSAGSVFTEIVIEETGIPVSGLQQGGHIGGLLEFRDQKVASYIAQLNSIAANLAFGVNQIHASGAPATPVATMISGQGANASIPLDDPAQAAPFASLIQTGSFTVHVYDASGTPTPPGGSSITITAGSTTMNDVVASLNAVPGLSASLDAAGRLTVNAGAGSVAFSDDSSNFLAAFEVGTFFSGGDASSLDLSSAIKNDAGAIHTGRVDPSSSVIQPGDNQVALSIIGLEETSYSVDGTPAASLHGRTANLSTQYGSDVATAEQQLSYRTAEAESLHAQRQVISGVNTDEELVNMIKFQRAYEAAAKVIQSTNDMLDSLLGLIR